MNIKKYFWDLNEEAVKEIPDILKNPGHPKFLYRVTTLLSHCDKPKEVFVYVRKNIFIDSWPKIRKYWKKTASAIDFLAWWETIYENLIKIKQKDIPAKSLIDIGNKIKKMRFEKGLSQQDIANLSRISQADISRIECGYINFKIISLLKILRVLKTKDFTIRGCK